MSWIRLVVSKPVSSWIEPAYTGLPTHPYMAVAISIDRNNIVRNQAAGIIRGMPVMPKTPRPFIEPNKTAATAANPEITRRIFVKSIYIRALTEGILVGRVGKVMHDLASLSIESVQGTRKEAYPQNAIGILINRLDPAG